MSVQVLCARSYDGFLGDLPSVNLTYSIEVATSDFMSWAWHPCVIQISDTFIFENGARLYQSSEFSEQAFHGGVIRITTDTRKNRMRCSMSGCSAPLTNSLGVAQPWGCRTTANPWMPCAGNSDTFYANSDYDRVGYCEQGTGGGSPVS